MSDSVAKPDVLEFSFNWNNKLECTCYSTIRIHNPKKYYAGKRFDVHLKKTFHHKAVVENVKVFKLSQLNDFMACIDTGYTLDAAKNIIRSMYHEQADTADFDFVLLRKTVE